MIELTYKQWTDELKGLILELNPHIDTHELVLTSINMLKRELLKLSSCREVDYYVADVEKIKALTMDDIRAIRRETALRNSMPKQKPTYKVEYLSKIDNTYELIEETVETVASQFVGKDGEKHHLNERGLRILETIYLGDR